MKAKAPISDDIRQAIALKAYYLWEADGRPHGKEHEHWAQAEAEILSVTPVKKAATKVAKPAAKEPVALAAAETAKEVAPKKPGKTAAKKTAAKTTAPKTKKAAKPKGEKNA
ncbi:putative membrane protein [Rhizomicrobium palustre]|uniref:Putative membrane protein n=1 Tax=Rhizomicrobium palustre TaxID=189966 RepID=A0A846MZU3_9PROT|nr:DUF2934 domain-containing protein [Rhizomicrobium palustre]NIK88457.1 putative membrane protein [Rhizomicrobium palustre]